ncbi:ABC transporter ATP-binding protein [Marinicrinis lubricantis]|uniref:ABC transporter ATP-binding protein n=1 Tax=Marinicrinis lubricantis TaxID=2086470 RepID=A0ABW1IL41_9BACL
MIRIEQLSHEFRIGKKGRERSVPVLQHIDLEVGAGEIVAIVGRSGSGKSTLLNLIAGYMAPSEGEIWIQDTRVSHFNEGQWANFRLEHMGFVFQSFQLIPSMTAFENVELPLTLKGWTEPKRKQKVDELLQRLGMLEYAEHYPGELSGGQQQRISIARALVLEPRLILADEPTGSLDTENELQILQLIRELNEQHGITFLMITHDEQVASIAHRTVLLKNGQIAGLTEEQEVIS